MTPLKPTHTPGPWIVYRAQFRSWPTIRNVDGLYVMDPPSGTSHARVRQDADARLIAAAPEMLAALQLAVRRNSHDMLLTGEELRACEAALSKALGGAS